MAQCGSGLPPRPVHLPHLRWRNESSVRRLERYKEWWWVGERRHQRSVSECFFTSSIHSNLQSSLPSTHPSIHKTRCALHSSPSLPSSCPPAPRLLHPLTLRTREVARTPGTPVTSTVAARRRRQTTAAPSRTTVLVRSRISFFILYLDLPNFEASSSGGRGGVTASGSATGGNGRGAGSSGGNAGTGSAGNAIGGSVFNTGGTITNTNGANVGGRGGSSTSGNARGGNAGQRKRATGGSARTGSSGSVSGGSVSNSASSTGTVRNSDTSCEYCRPIDHVPC